MTAQDPGIRGRMVPVVEVVRPTWAGDGDVSRMP